MFLNHSSFNTVWSSLSLFSWLWSGLLDNTSTFFWELPGLCTSWKLYSWSSVVHWAWWQLSFWGFLKYPKFLWSVHISNWSFPIRYCLYCLSPSIISNNSVMIDLIASRCFTHGLLLLLILLHISNRSISASLVGHVLYSADLTAAVMRAPERKEFPMHLNIWSLISSHIMRPKYK